MGEYILNDKELLYLITTFSGSEAEESNWNQISEEAERSLDNKGLIQMDFDGNRNIDEKLWAMLEKIFLSETEVVIDLRLPGKSNSSQSIYYVNDNNVYVIKSGTQEEYVLKQTDREELRKALIIPNTRTEQAESNYYTITIDQLSQAYDIARKNNRAEAEKILCDFGLPEKMAERIAGVAVNQTGVYSVQFKSTISGEVKIGTRSFLLTDKLLQMDTDYNSEGSIDISYSEQTYEKAEKLMQSAAEEAGLNINDLWFASESFE